MPKWLIEKPEILIGLEWYYRAFTDLSTCRSYGMSEGPIPWLAVNEYAIRHRMTHQEFDDLWEVVRKLDAVYIKERAGKAKIENSRIGSKQPPSRGR